MLAEVDLCWVFLLQTLPNQADGEFVVRAQGRPPASLRPMHFLKNMGRKGNKFQYPDCFLMPEWPLAVQGSCTPCFVWHSIKCVGHHFDRHRFVHGSHHSFRCGAVNFFQPWRSHTHLNEHIQNRGKLQPTQTQICSVFFFFPAVLRYKSS